MLTADKYGLGTIAHYRVCVGAFFKLLMVYHPLRYP